MNKIGEIDTYDYEEYYEKNYGRSEERLLTQKELHDLYFMCEIARENKIRFMISFAPCTCSYCIHKTPENKWVVSHCGERRDGYIYGIFDNIYDACVLLINMLIDENKRTQAINKFNKKLSNEIDNNELESFALSRAYYDKYFYYDFQQTIKKMSGIKVDEDPEVEKRISNRKDRIYVTGTSFDELVNFFVDNIKRTLNIDTSDLYNKWYNNKIDYKTYYRLMMQRINLKGHQDLVLKELEKYNNQQIEEKLSCQDGPSLNKRIKHNNN